jgi:dethiobiotin synthetase
VAPDLPALSRSLFLTGTDTNVGKTHVAERLVRSLRARGIDAVGMKPLCCGDRDDAERLHAASGGEAPLNTINPVWLRTPAAPYTASLIENRPLDLALVFESYNALRASHAVVVVEGAGGWLVPITADYFLSDLAAAMDLPVAVVAANKLGALNHTLLTVQAIEARALPCAGVILNHTTPDSGDPATTTNRAVLESLLRAPILWEVPYEPGTPGDGGVNARG